MIFNNMEFHNVTEMEQVNGLAGWRLRRFPTSVRQSLGGPGYDNGRLASQTSTGCEIRFVTSSSIVKMYLTALDADGEVVVYRGDFVHSIHRLQEGRMTSIVLKDPEIFSKVQLEMLDGGSFSPDVWRVTMSRGFSAVFHDVDAMGHDIRPPEAGETPKLRWLAYGSSITHGARASTYSNSYIQQTARRLGVDVLCNGLSGACMCESEMTDYIATRGDWNFATLELGVNMRQRFTSEQFEERVRYLLSKMMQHHHDKPIVMISIYPNSATFLRDTQDLNRIRNQQFNEILLRLHEELAHPNLHFIEGSEILTDITGLTTDLLHPSDYGHMLMGENLARRLKGIVRL